MPPAPNRAALTRDPVESRRMQRPWRAAHLLAAGLVSVGAVTASAPAPLSAQATAFPTASSQSPAAPSPQALNGLRWRHVGPVGNRVSAVTGVPGDPDVYFVGAASGGIFRSVDGGHGWEPVFDDAPVASIGALAVDPSDPDRIWAGTGESKIRSNVSHGLGIWRSDDGGDSWTSRGLEATGRIGRIAIHPGDPDVVYVAALGHLYGPQEERGVFRTTDGGETWERVLFVGPGTGASDILLDPDDPSTVYAGMWTMHIRTWGRWSGGPDGGLYRSRDGGDTWERLRGNGLPPGMTGKIGLTASPADPDRIYALIETSSNRAFAPVEEHEGVLWRSDDDGATWSMVNADHRLVQRPHYYTRAVAAPDDASEVHFLATLHTRSRDGGRTVTVEGGGDYHDLWIDPVQPDRIIVGLDQGVKISTTRGASWFRPFLPIAQMYHVTVDTDVPYNLYGNRQDGPSFRGPSRTLHGGGIPVGAWREVGGCESGWAVPDTVSGDVVWSGCYEGILDRHTLSTGHSRTVSVWPDNPEGWPAGPLRDRFQWTFPILLSPHDQDRVYVGSQRVHRTADGGQSWEVVSPDLTTDLDSLQRKTGGLTPDDVSPTYAAVLFALAESPLVEGELWAGSNDGLVHRSPDGGATWEEVTPPASLVGTLGTVSNIEPSRHDPATVYLAVDRHQLGDFDPYVLVSRDRGATWTRIDDGLPRTPLGFAHVVREDPVRPGLLYLGTGNALHASFDDGASWVPLQRNLPHAPVHWITVQPGFRDLVVATYGRGFWILDDVTPLRAWSPEVEAAPLRLVEPRPAWRFLPVASPVSQPGDPAEGENPPYGASLSYWLSPEAAGGEVRVEILDGVEVVATLDRVPAEAGLNRTWWNLRYEPSRRPTLRMPPLEHAHAGPAAGETAGPRDGGRVSILAPPGTYTVRLVTEAGVEEAPLEVRMDPRSRASGGSLEGIRAQTAMLLELRDQVDRVVELIDAMEGLRFQAAELRPGPAAGTGGAAGMGPVLEAARALETALAEVEGELFDLRLTGGQDTLRWPRRLYAKLTSLAGYVSGTDHPPTDQAREVHALYRDRLAQVETRYQEVLESELAELNRRLREAGREPLAAAGPDAVDAGPAPADAIPGGTP